MTGVSAGLLARGGFSGAPAITVEGEDVADIWTDLGQTWLTEQQDLKSYAVCYWAQAATAGALAVQRTHQVPLVDILRIQVHTFHEAAHLAIHRPRTTEEAQYSLPFPVAATLIHGQLGVDQLTGSGLQDRQVLGLADRMVLVADPDYSSRFPQEPLARVRIETTQGETFDSGETKALWDGIPQPTDDELRQKFRWLVRGRLPPARAHALEEAAWGAADLTDARVLPDLLVPPVEPSSVGAA